ncbi:MAG: 3-hydroxyacyl-CoA dehydrogenase/enoyl-CoA hydratase family protein [Bradymonadia bacterium]
MNAVNKGLKIRSAAVLGAGVMGRGIAAHLAGCGIEVLMLDIVPPGEEKSDDKAVRNKFAAGGLQAALKNKPALFYNKADADMITVGNFDDDLHKVAEVDWVVEVVKEDLAIKHALFEKLDAIVSPGTLISSNTSGLPLAQLIEGRSDNFKQNFIITHFFNPVRYMRLLEVVDGPETDPTLKPRFTVFARQTLGKGVVIAKDSPAFIANRIGTFSMMYTMHKMIEAEQSPEFVDAIFGKAAGRPKSALFRTGDVVGLDTLSFVTTDLYNNLPEDPMRDYFKVPNVLQTLLDKGWLGAKSKQGFYKRDRATKVTYTFDPYTLEYREKLKIRADSIKAAKGKEESGERIKALLAGDDDAAKFAWDCVAQTLIYAANRLGEVSDDLVQIDNGLKWGFGHDLGPFETWDALGVQETVDRMEADGYTVPGWVKEMLGNKRTSFYEGPLGERNFWDAKNNSSATEQVSPRMLRLPSSITDPSLVAKNHGARLWDIGDGVACLEFRTKMNSVSADIIEMMHEAVEIAEEKFDALIVGNHGNPGEGQFGQGCFSAGADLLSVMMGIGQQAWDDIEKMIRGFQSANNKLRHSSIPVVAAPYDYTFGGGAEVCFGANAIQAHPELFMGLVEVGVGLIPGGGGCFALLHNISENAPKDADPVTFVREAALTIGMAKFSTSAEEARKLGFLRNDDRVTMDRDELLEGAKQRALGMARSDFKAPKPRSLKVAGRTGYATLYSALWGMNQSNFASEHDLKVLTKLAYILTGGDVVAGTRVTEQQMQDLEVEAFLSLCGEEKTQARIQHMLMNNKPLRN